MNAKFYSLNDGGVMDAARLKLALFDENTVRDIIALVNYRGTGLLDDIYRNSTEADPPHILGVMGSDFCKAQDVPGVLLGLSTVIMASLRKPKMGPDEYADILATAFGLPTLLARGYANQIESYDSIIADANQDQKAEFSEHLQQYVNVLEEGARRIVNGLSNALGLSTVLNWDQTQDYDVDFLDELYNLGEIVVKLNRRARLMSGQSLIMAQMQLFQTGDIEEEGDPLAEMVGDIVAAAGARALPASLTGNFRDTMLKARRASLGMGQSLFSHAGIGVNPATKQLTTTPTTQAGGRLRTLLSKVLTKNPVVATILGASKLLSGAKKKLLSSSKSSDSGVGDVVSLYGDIAEGYGEPLADAWLIGDVEGIVDALTGDLPPDSTRPFNDGLLGNADEPSETGFLGIGKRKKRRRARRAYEESAEGQAEMSADYARRAAVQQAKIRRENMEAIRRARGVSPSDYFSQVDPSAGLDFSAGYQSSQNITGGGMTDAISNPDDAALLSGVPNLDAGATFDSSVGV